MNADWILVTDRLPESDDRPVLATLDWRGLRYIDIVLYCPDDEDLEWVYAGSGNEVHDDVIAWMPVPYPYNGSSGISTK